MVKRITLSITVFLLTLSCDQKSAEDSTSESFEPKHEGHSHDNIESFYTCSMHPQIKSDKPGKCPICFMNLTKVSVEKTNDIAEAAESNKNVWRCENHPEVTSEIESVCPIDGSPMIKAKAGSSPGDIMAKIKLKESQRSHFKPAYFPVSPMKMTKSIRLLGSVIQSEKKESAIPAKIGGRVEKVLVESTGSLIKRGDPVLKLYSPKLITAGEEYILARKAVKENSGSEFLGLLRQSEERLKLWGINPNQYNTWFERGSVPKDITIYSDVSGVVSKRNATKGKYFKEGENFFELSDLSSVWVEMDVYEHDSTLVKLGQTVTLQFTALPGKNFVGNIDFINPFLNPKSRTLKVRVTINNDSGRLMPGMVADATLLVNLEGTSLVVPRSAVIDTGERQVVWTKIDERNFQAKIVQTGRESEGYVEVMSGLEAGELVVVEGSFLLDAQAQLFGGYEDFKSESTLDPHTDH